MDVEYVFPLTMKYIVTFTTLILPLFWIQILAQIPFSDSPYFSIELSDRDSARYYGFDYSNLSYTIDGIEKTAIVTGSTCKFRFSKDELTTNEVTISFNYFIGHNYSISFLGFADDGYNIGPGYEWTTYSIGNKVNSQAGYTTSDGLYFNFDGASLELTVSK